MRLVSKNLDPADRRQIGLRVHPEVRKALRVMAAKADETMEDTLHRILVRELCSLDLLPAAFQQGR
jgi:DNA-binding MarR family transcriptional regulator